MADQNSVQYAKEIAAIQTLRAAWEMGGRVRVAVAQVVAATWNSADIANLFTMPQGARLVGGFAETDGLGTSCTVSLGYSGAAAAILAATAMATAGQTQLPLLAAVGLDCSGKLITATLGGANATNGKLLTVVLYFVVD